MCYETLTGQLLGSVWMSLILILSIEWPRGSFVPITVPATHKMDITFSPPTKYQQIKVGPIWENNHTPSHCSFSMLVHRLPVPCPSYSVTASEIQEHSPQYLLCWKKGREMLKRFLSSCHICCFPLSRKAGPPLIPGNTRCEVLSCYTALKITIWEQLQLLSKK